MLVKTQFGDVSAVLFLFPINDCLLNVKLDNSLLNIRIVYLCIRVVSFVNKSFKPETKVKTFGRTTEEPGGLQSMRLQRVGHN